MKDNIVFTRNSSPSLLTFWSLLPYLTKETPLLISILKSLWSVNDTSGGNNKDWSSRIKTPAQPLNSTEIMGHTSVGICCDKFLEDRLCTRIPFSEVVYKVLTLDDIQHQHWINAWPNRERWAQDVRIVSNLFAYSQRMSSSHESKKLVRGWDWSRCPHIALQVVNGRYEFRCICCDDSSSRVLWKSPSEERRTSILTV